MTTLLEKTMLLAAFGICTCSSSQGRAFRPESAPFAFVNCVQEALALLPRCHNTVGSSNVLSSDDGWRTSEFTRLTGSLTKPKEKCHYN
jgi:hypothetical protein